jgi:hypothetical protein
MVNHNFTSSFQCAFALQPIAEGTEAGDSRMKRIALVTSILNFFVSLCRGENSIKAHHLTNLCKIYKQIELLQFLK